MPPLDPADDRVPLLHSLRTVGRPDMALFKFTKAMLADQPIEIYNHGRSRRDFTYIDDLVESILRLTEVIPAGPGMGAATVPGDTLSRWPPTASSISGAANPCI